MKKSRLLGDVCMYIKRIVGTIGIIFSLLLAAPAANASIIIDVQEVAGNVVASYNGTLDLASTAFKEADRVASLSLLGSGNQPGALQFYSTEGAVDDYNLLGFTSAPNTNVLTGTASGGNIFGDYLLIDFIAPDSYGQIWVNDGYQSGANISGSNTFIGTDFTSLGLNSGSYTWTWANGSASDSLIVNVGPVPVPPALWLFGSGLLGLVGMARRKKAA